jgi:hypothetical protein
VCAVVWFIARRIVDVFTIGSEAQKKEDASRLTGDWWCSFSNNPFATLGLTLCACALIVGLVWIAVVFVMWLVPLVVAYSNPCFIRRGEETSMEQGTAPNRTERLGSTTQRANGRV